MFKKNNIVIISFFIYLLLIPMISYSFEDSQTITITKEDIVNSTPSPYPVSFDKKDLKDIEIMEKRHFPKTYPELSDFERLKNLEWELFGKIWVYSPTKDRIKKLKLASSNTMLIGTALPASLSSKRTVKRMRNNDLDLRKRDEPGLIDGFLRLISPEKYEVYRKHADHRFNDYEW